VSISNYYGDVRKGIAVAFALALLASGCGSTKKTATRTTSKLDEGAAKFAVSVQAQLKSGRFARAWRSLHPAERKVVPAQQLASCYPKNEFPRSVAFRARQVRDVRWTVPGTAETTDAKEVTIAVTAANRRAETFTQHVVRVRGGWAWMLSGAYFKRARAGKC
jgi:hypothetical protein